MAFRRPATTSPRRCRSSRRGSASPLFDHLGFGFSDKPAGDVSYSLLDQGRRAGEVARALGIERARVVGHDMGLTVAVEMLCRQEAGTLGFAMEALGLCNGSHLVELANITPLQHALMTDEGAAAFAQSYDPERFAQGFRFVWADASRTPEVDIRAIAYWLSLNGGLDIVGRIARYNLERTAFADRWRPILGRTDVPISVVWGDRDPIAVHRDRPAPGGDVRRTADGPRRRRPLPADGSAGGVGRGDHRVSASPWSVTSAHGSCS